MRITPWESTPRRLAQISMFAHSSACAREHPTATKIALANASNSALPMRTESDVILCNIYAAVLDASRRLALVRREAAIEGVALGGEIEQERRRLEARAVFLFQRLAQFDELLRSHHVDVGQRAAGERRKAETQDRAHIGLAHVGDHALLEGARGFQRLHDQEAGFQLLDADFFRIELLRLQIEQSGPQ